MKPLFFETAAAFRKWLQKNHTSETAVIVGYYKAGTSKPSMNWSESVDQALCFGWIDGVRRSIDEESYCNRFTPRKPKSNWSAININKVETLKKKGLMQPAGLAAYEKRQESKSKIYSYEKEAAQLDTNSERIFKSSKKAWNWFNEQAPYYKRLSIHWVMDARQEVTKLKRLAELVADSEAALKLKQYRPLKKK